MALEEVSREWLASQVPNEAPRRVSLVERLPLDRLIELGAAARSARTSAAVSLVIHAQHAGEPVVWIQPEGGSLYPPDLAACGVDLTTLVVVHVPAKSGVRAAGTGGPRTTEKDGAHGLARAAELLLRSGAFGLVVIDLTAGTPRGDAWQGRLAAMARQHASRVVILRESSDRSPSLGPMIAMRVHATREKRAPGRYAVAYRVLKDKTGLTGDPSPDPRRAPTGLS